MTSRRGWSRWGSRCGAGLVEGVGEDGVGVVQLASHAGALAALAGEQERRSCPAAQPRPAPPPGRLGPSGQGRQRRASSSSRSAARTTAARCVEPAARGGQRVRDVGAGRAPSAARSAQPPAWARSAASACADSTHGDRRRDPAAPAGRRPVAGSCRRRPVAGLLEDDVGVGAADAERGDARRGAGRSGAGQAPASVSSSTAPGGPVHVRATAASTCRVCGSMPCRIAMHHLDDAGDAGGGLGVADVGLERAQPQRPVRRAVLAVGGQQRLRLDRVAERGAGAVRLDRVHVGGGQPGVGQRLADHPLLGRAVRGGQAVAARRPG